MKFKVGECRAELNQIQSYVKTEAVKLCIGTGNNMGWVFMEVLHY